jgi:hypothetical protein
VLKRSAKFDGLLLSKKHDFKNSLMKKNLQLSLRIKTIILLNIITFIAGCGGSNSDPATAPMAPPLPTVNTPPSAEIKTLSKLDSAAIINPTLKGQLFYVPASSEDTTTIVGDSNFKYYFTAVSSVFVQ